MVPPMQQRAASLFVLVLVELRPAALEEASHGVAGLAHLRRVLVEEFAVVENQLSVGSKLLTAAVPERHSDATKFQQTRIVSFKGVLSFGQNCASLITSFDCQ